MKVIISKDKISVILQMAGTFPMGEGEGDALLPLGSCGITALEPIFAKAYNGFKGRAKHPRFHHR